MDWTILIAMAVLICPLMMIGMIVGGWLMGRSAGHSGHGMGCMGHGHGSAHGDDGQDVIQAGHH